MHLSAKIKKNYRDHVSMGTSVMLSYPKWSALSMHQMNLIGCICIHAYTDDIHICVICIHTCICNNDNYRKGHTFAGVHEKI